MAAAESAPSRCPAAKRLMREAAELASRRDDSDEVGARPLADNLFEWHFTVRGPPGTDFDGGVYHGRILLPYEYPMRPPHIILLTPNGRFETNRKICLSISGHHPETWQPSWSIRTALVALRAFLPTPAEGTVGSLDYSPKERRALAKRSVDWSCDRCGRADSLLLERDEAADPNEPVPPPSPPPPPPPPRERRPSSRSLPREPDAIVASPRDTLDGFRDCIVACLAISIAVFLYRRVDFLSHLSRIADLFG